LNELSSAASRRFGKEFKINKNENFVQNNFIKKHCHANSNVPVTDIHLYSDLMYEFKANGDGKTTYFLLIIAAFIIVWVNYVNLSTAKSMERAKEVGIRKVMGSVKHQLTSQFLVESFLLNFIGLILAIILTIAILPYFNNLSGVRATFSLFDKTLWLTIAGLLVFGGFLSGIYPALVLAGFKPATVLKGRLGSSAGGAAMRKGLVIFQFIASLVLMVGTATVFEQLRFMQNQELGVNIDQTMIINGPNVTDSLYNDKFNAFALGVNALSSISSVTSSTAVPGGQPGWNAGGIRLVEQPDTEEKQYRIIGIDGDFIDAYDMELVAGRKFDKERSQEQSTVLFNESAVELLGFSPEDALNRDIFFWGDTFKIVGVLKDYHQESLKKSFEPLIFRYFPSVTGFYSVKVQTERLHETIESIEKEWQAAFPGNPFEYFFLDDHFNQQYKAEMRFGKVFGLFACLAIFIACLGLFGLASYMTKYRTKEIGIRKVLGASVSNIWMLLSRDFSMLIVIATLIAIPVSWYVIHLWLQDFASRIHISWWLFALPAFVLMFIALFSVSFQTTKSALSNPVDALRDE
jgi:putative ABC transport system permease protein